LVLPGQGRKYRPLKNQPAKQPQTFDRRISQITWSLETKFRGDDEHPKERICPKNYGLKLHTTPGIVKPSQKHYELGFIRKSTNRRPNPVFEGSRSSTKRHKALTHDPLKEIKRQSTPKSMNRATNEKNKKRLQKSPKKRNGRSNKNT
jgi:hypothetical protein